MAVQLPALNWTVEHILLIANLEGRNVRLCSSSSFSIWVTGFIFNEAYLAFFFTNILHLATILFSI